MKSQSSGYLGTVLSQWHPDLPSELKVKCHVSQQKLLLFALLNTKELQILQKAAVGKQNKVQVFSQKNPKASTMEGENSKSFTFSGVSYERIG